MATFLVVDKDKDPLGAGEINAGETVAVNDGDIVIIDPTANDKVTFESATGSVVTFSVDLNTSNSNSFELEFLEDLSPTVTIGDGVDLSAVTINADKTDAITLIAADNVTLKEYKGSQNGIDTLSIGDDFTTTSNLKTENGDDVVSIGARASLRDVETGKGADTITLGEGTTAQNIKTAEASDTISIGDQSSIQNLETGKGSDDVTIGDDFTGSSVKTEGGNDIVRLGANASLNELDGGSGGGDVLNTQTTGLTTKAFETENVVCFVRGTRIRSPAGNVPIEDLAVGDLVVTADHGLQPIRWIGSSRVHGAGHLAPIEVAQDVFGNPRALRLSPQHRILVRDWRLSLYFGVSEVLVPAKHLVDGTSIKPVECAEVEYFHLLFEAHEILLAEGAPCESFYPAGYGMGTMQEGVREEIYEILPELRGDVGAYGNATRRSLRRNEAALLRA